MRVKIIKSRDGKHLGEEGFIKQSGLYFSTVYLKGKEISAQNSVTFQYMGYIFDYIYEEIDDYLVYLLDIDL